ncbi:MAG: ImmA/IrrE family metallo-endopeptidase [Acidobacteriota bacterium]
MPGDREGAARRATELLSEYAIDAPSQLDLDALAFAAGALVLDAPLLGALARLVRRGDRGIIRVREGLTSPRRRFCIAHELGHFLLHGGTSQLASCTLEMIDDYRASREELEANAFAAELLLPRAAFQERCGAGAPTADRVRTLADEFGVSLTATLWRTAELGPTPGAIVGAREGRLSWFKRSDDFLFRLRDVGSRVGREALAHAACRGEREGIHHARVPARSWLDDRRVEESWTLGEICVPMLSVGSSLSLIWLTPDAGVDDWDEGDDWDD